MTRNCLLASMILFVSFCILGCASAPPPIKGDLSLPQVFEEVWYRSTLSRPGFTVMSDTGILTVHSDSLKFAGGKETVSIPLSDIQKLTFEKLGSDFVNNWVIVEYGEKESPSYAVMSAGKSMGWAGGSDKIYSSIEYVIRKNKS